MSRFIYYIKPFDVTGELSSTWVDVTNDVLSDSLGSVKQFVDDTDFEVGVYRYDSISIKMYNRHGKYSDVSASTSIFNKRRSGSVFKIVYNNNYFDPQCGVAEIGQHRCHAEVTLFEGLLNDETALTNSNEESTFFTILSYDSILEKEEANFSDYTVLDSYKDIIFNTLNTENVTKYVTVDIANINPKLNLAVDDISKFEEKSKKEIVDLILKQSSSVLYVRDNTIYVTEITPTVEVKFNFYGSGSDNGIQNILKLTNAKTGINKIFNKWVWKDTLTLSKDSASISNYGLRKAEDLDFDEITEESKRQSILNEKISQFSTPKQSFIIEVPANYETVLLNFLDHVLVDYPVEYFAAQSSVIPIYGVSKYEEVKYPEQRTSFYIENNMSFLIVGREINLSKKTIKFKLQES